MAQARDRIYRHESHGSFVFDDKVASVFPDMIERSVPGYASIISMIGVFAEQYARDDSVCYDLGSSLGAASLLMRHQVRARNCRIVAVDNSRAMIDRCAAILEQDERDSADADASPLPVELICDDVEKVPMARASVVVLNFTLQFVAREKRAALIRKIHEAMLPGAVLVLSEKIRFEDEAVNQLYIDMHHRFKQANGYSELEISRKRSALENVLVPETIEQHRARLKEAGFADCHVWFQCFNFVSMLALKD